MRTIKFIILFYFTVNLVTAQDNFYYYKGKKVPLVVSANKVLIKFIKGLNIDTKKQIVASDFSLKPLNKSQIETIPDVLLVDIKNEVVGEQIQWIISKLNKNNNILVATPVFLKDTMIIGLTDEFIVKLKSPSDYVKFQNLTKKTNTLIDRKYEFQEGVYIVKADKNSNGNALKMANYFFEQGFFEFCEPNFLQQVDKESNDQHFNDQWALNNTGQSGGSIGADIKVLQAWQITMGRPEIKVAVLDGGVDLIHPDLINNLLPGYDATGGGSNGAPTGNDAHGTACAGVIAATANNGIGVAGVAPLCKIIPIRIYVGGGDIYDLAIALDMAAGIDWAWQNEADILSNSWRTLVGQSIIDAAILGAVTNGRGQLGCPVVFAAGNQSNGYVAYPGSNPNVIAVGATDRNDIRANFSNNGSDLDVVAPGVSIVTTDISGSAGYSASGQASTYNNDYVSSIDGTSFSCPYTAGTLALILSVNRCLTQTQARRILELSCDKVNSSLCYNPGKENGLWNDEMGYGRINAYKAVLYAYSIETNAFVNISGTNQGSTSNFSWFLSNGGCSNLAAANYIVKRHEIRANVTFPHTPSPSLIGSVNGFSAASPNSGNYYMEIVNITSTDATVRTWVYEVISTISGQQVGWVPTDPASVRFNFAVLNSLIPDLYFQNQFVNSFETHSALYKIEAGKNVTNAVPVGDYILQSGSNVTFHSGQVINLYDGFFAELNSEFTAYVDPLFTCTQYPFGKVINATNTDDFPPVIKEYESIILGNNIDELEKPSLKNFPNPFTSFTTIEYQIKKSNSVTLSLTDYNGRQLLVLKNNQPHEKGKYQIKLVGFSLVPGVYYYTIQSDDYLETKRMIKIE